MLTNITGWLLNLSRAGKLTMAVLVLAVANVAAYVIVPHETPPTKSSKSDAKTLPTSTAIISEDQVITYEKKTEEDPTLPAGTKKLQSSGANGIKTLTYRVTRTDGRETSRVLIKEEITIPVIDEVTLIGTYVDPEIVAPADPFQDPTAAPPADTPPQSNRQCDHGDHGCIDR